MKTNNNIYIFFIIITLLFFNPITYYLIYSNTPTYTLKLIKITIWFIFILGIFAIYLIKSNRLNDKFRNIILSVAFIGILFILLVTIDSLIGFIKVDKSNKTNIIDGLLFEPNSIAKYQTVEFEHLAIINSIGLRDKEINVDKGNSYRILCFGDSWTFGWGVNIEDSWPKKLEAYFQRKGYENIEVINCGKSGTYTSSYKKSMEKYVPLLKPDLVLIGVLQLDDLAQLYENNYLSNQDTKKITIFNNIKISAKAFLKGSFANIFKIVRQNRGSTINIKYRWRENVESLISRFNNLQLISFNTLDDTVKSLFKSGDLNPGLLYEYINFPYRCLIFNDPSQKATVYAIEEMKKDFRDMDIICKENNANLVFLNLPMDYFTGHNVVRSPVDHYIKNYLYNNNKIDQMYMLVASNINIPYFELTNKFKGLSDKSSYFYRYGGHPNKNGYEEIAIAIGDYLISKDIIPYKTSIIPK